MTQTSPSILIRTFKTSDRATVRRISCETSFLEHSRHSIIDDDEILADILTRYFTDYEPESCFVAEINGEIHGYIIGAVNEEKMLRIFYRKVFPLIFLKAIFRGFFFKWKHWRLFFSYLNGFRKQEFGHHINLNPLFPSVLHINIDPPFRGKSIGKDLIQCFLNYLKQQGTSGVHLVTMSFKAKDFFIRNGFILHTTFTRTHLKHYFKDPLSVYILTRDLRS